jgi:hypothetical protein
VGAVVAWVATALGAQVFLSLARRGGPEAELAARRRVQPALAGEHAALALALVSGVALLRLHGWGLGHARWLGLKLGLVAFLVVPLEAFHAYVCHVWLARALRGTSAPPFPRDLERAIGVDEMVRAIAAPLLGLGLPVIVWLSLARPF